MRPLPQLTPANRWLWASGEDGKLRIQAGGDCGQLVHPPVSVCPSHRGRTQVPTVMSGRGTVVGFTVNHRQWSAAFAPPYAVADVALDEDAGVHLTRSLVSNPSARHLLSE